MATSGARYRDLLTRLYAARRFGVVLGLERMRDLLDRLDLPAAKLGTIVHVGGTNGKGSVVAMLGKLVADGGYRVASYTSPHLSSLRERIAFNGIAIDEHAVVAAADVVEAAGGNELTFFEQMTAIAAVAIAEAGVDVTILEVGLGGRLDATNAFAAPVAVVTGVALDHEAVLGPTLLAIAREKAGIFKPGQRIVVGASGEPAAVPLLIAAAAVGSATTIIDEAAIAAVPPVGLAGVHQRANAAAALAALDHLGALGVARVDPMTRARALATVTHPARFEAIGDVIVDGAHNPHGAAALAATLRERRLDGATIIAAISEDKQVAAIASALAPVAGRVIATRYQQERSLDPATVAAAFRTAGVAEVTTAPELASALTAARGGGRAAATPIVVCGSLFLAGEARVLLAHAPADPFVVTDPPAR